MDDQHASPADEHVSTHEPARGQRERWLPRIVFAVVSVVFLVYLAMGSVEARIWRFGRLYFEDRDIRHVWAYAGDRLPDLPAQGVFSVLFWASVAVMIAGTILGLWLFLGTDDDDPAGEVIAGGAEQAPPHA